MKKKRTLVAILWLKTLITYAAWLVIFIVFTPLAVLIACLPASLRYENRFYFWFTGIWCRLLLATSFVPWHVKQNEKLPLYPDEPAIIIMNHASAFDIFLVEALLGSYPHIWMSKHEYGFIPFFGFLLRRMHILITRNASPTAMLSSLRKACSLAKNYTTHLLIFPEGTRHHDGKVHEFYEGFVLLAQQLKRPIIPIAIKNINHVFPKGHFMIDSSAPGVTLKIGDPFSCHASTLSRKELVEYVRTWFIKELEH